MTLQSFPSDASKYDLLQEIGKGATSVVYRAKANGSQECAVKVFKLKELPEDSEERIFKEISTLSMLDHPNIIRLYASFVKGEDFLWMIMPLISHGAVLDVMRDGGFTTGLPEEAVGAILGPTLDALAYLHSMNGIHRDLKAGNIFMQADGTVFLGDFGVAANLIEGGEAATGKRTFAGTPCWMAPEVMMQQGSYASPADIWSFGIMAIEIAKGRAPHAELHAMKVVMKVMSSQPPSLDEGDDKKRFSKQLRALVKRCLVKEPDQRPTAVQLLKDPFFKKIKDKSYLASTILSKMPPIWERKAQNSASDPERGIAAAAASIQNDGNGKSNASNAVSNAADVSLPRQASGMGRFGALAAEVDNESQTLPVASTTPSLGRFGTLAAQVDSQTKLVDDQAK